MPTRIQYYTTNYKNYKNAGNIHTFCLNAHMDTVFPRLRLPSPCRQSHPEPNMVWHPGEQLGSYHYYFQHLSSRPKDNRNLVDCPSNPKTGLSRPYHGKCPELSSSCCPLIRWNLTSPFQRSSRRTSRCPSPLWRCVPHV